MKTTLIADDITYLLSSTRRQIKFALLKTFTVAFLLTITNNVFANNILISNTTTTGKDITNDFILVQFDVSWENSWRTSSGPSNWDAAWVFVKYRTTSSNDWFHATLHWIDGTGAADGHTEPANTNISSDLDNGTNEAHGVFIHSSIDINADSVNYTGVQLRWDYGTDGVADADVVEVCVYAIEMVYVPQASFYLGDGVSEQRFYTYPTDTDTYLVSNENAITLAQTNGNLWFMPGGGTGSAGTIPATYPKGYNAFYCMKYEITQEQYVAYLNKLTSTQATARYYSEDAFRHIIAGSYGNYSTINPNVPYGYMNWTDFAAYLDWAALRPMTDLEFEKACRGPLTPVGGEYAWGTTNISSTLYTLSNEGENNEAIATGYNTVLGNVARHETIIGGIDGPVRVGIFAANSGNTGRVTSGASYYGIMELSGNLSELCIAGGRPQGWVFDGIHGDGALTTAGLDDVTNWPNNAGAFIGIGAGHRGGNYLSWDTSAPIAEFQRVSNRYSANAYTYLYDRRFHHGGRGVRTAQ